MRKGVGKLLKIALCDDITEYNKKMESYIKRYSNENHIDVKISSYLSGAQLLLNYQKRKFDIIFLDISIPEMDGFEIAKKIREKDHDIIIIFCTSYYTITNASKGFEVEAEDFLAKPMLYKKIEKILNKAYGKKLINAEEKLILKCQNGIYTLQLSDIIYLETSNKTVLIHTVKGDFICYQKIRDLEERLSNKLFYRCHNCYLVNMDFIETVKGDTVVLTKGGRTTVPISKYRKDGLLKALAMYVGEKL